ncbi:MAG: prepilin-type N-terminal cleavage/methylation domain-containing protein [Desulfobulbaceae bacterium]|nr:prepilin-type N-terminal cleavage/methylation domain-containing protein [Desulfobulbaceae bacterium]
MRKTLNIAGFSLIELMIVVAIIGILATVAMPAYINHIYRVRESGGVERLLDLKVAQEKFHALYDTYSADVNDANFAPLLSFDPADAMYNFAIPAADADTFTARVQADLNGDGNFTNCWDVTESPAAPAKNSAAAGCSADGEGFSLSLITGLL